MEASSWLSWQTKLRTYSPDDHLGALEVVFGELDILKAAIEAAGRMGGVVDLKKEKGRGGEWGRIKRKREG